MTIHAGLGGWQTGGGGSFDGGVAVAAINVQITGMQLMAVGHRLLGLVTYISIFR